MSKAWKSAWLLLQLISILLQESEQSGRDCPTSRIRYKLIINNHACTKSVYTVVLTTLYNNSACPESDAAFSCKTTTGVLIWHSGTQNLLYTNESALHSQGHFGIFSSVLVQTEGSCVISMATTRARSGVNGTSITCRDGILSDSVTKILQVAGDQKDTHSKGIVLHGV